MPQKVKGKKKKVPRARKGKKKANVAKKVQQVVRQEIAANVIPAVRPMKLPPRVALPIKQTKKGHLLVKDREYIGQVSISDTQAVGDHVFRTILSPQDLAGTRIQVYSRLYEKYRFRKATVHYVPMCGSTKEGTLIGYCDVDVLDAPQTGVGAVRNAESATGSKMFHIFQPSQFHLPQNEGNGEFFYTDTGEDVRLSQQGLIDIVCVSGNPSAQPISAGFLYLDYEIEFKVSHTVGSTLTAMSRYISDSTTVSSSHPVGTLPLQDSHSDYPLTFVGNGIYFPFPAWYWVCYQQLSTVSACGIDFAPGGGATFKHEFGLNSGTSAIRTVFIHITDSSADFLSITLTGGSGTIGANLQVNSVQGVDNNFTETESTSEENRIVELEKKISILMDMLQNSNGPRSMSGLKTPPLAR
jgi:hypothetical protein